MNMDKTQGGFLPREVQIPCSCGGSDPVGSGSEEALSEGEGLSPGFVGLCVSVRYGCRHTTRSGDWSNINLCSQSWKPEVLIKESAGLIPSPGFEGSICPWPLAISYVAVFPSSHVSLSLLRVWVQISFLYKNTSRVRAHPNDLILFSLKSSISK